MFKEILVKTLMNVCKHETARDIRRIEKEMKKNPDTITENLTTYADLRNIFEEDDLYSYIEYNGELI